MTTIGKCVAILRKASFLTKTVAIVNSSIILGFYLGVYQWLLVYGNAHQLVLPFVVCSSFLMITTLTCVAQLCNKETPTYLVIAYDIQGVLLFAAVGIICFICWGKATGISMIENPLIPMPQSLNRPAILVSAILGIANSIVYMLDAVLTFMERWKKLSRHQ